MDNATPIGVRINGIKVADWAEAEYRRKIHAEWLVQFFAQVRGIFVFLLIATIFVFVQNHRVEVQAIASAGLHQTTISDKLRQQALQHEEEVDQINK